MLAPGPLTLIHQGTLTRPKAGDVLLIDRYGGVVKLLRDDLPVHPALLEWPMPPNGMFPPGRSTRLTLPEAAVLAKFLLSLFGLHGVQIADDGDKTVYQLITPPA